MTKQALRKILICAFGFGLCLCLMLAINHVASPALADGPGYQDQQQALQTAYRKSRSLNW